jgi:hypothetical protein
VRRRCGGQGGAAAAGAMRRPRWCGGNAVAGVVRRRLGVVRRRLGRCRSIGVDILGWALLFHTGGRRPVPRRDTADHNALGRGAILPSAGPASPTWLVNSVAKAPLTRALYFSTRRPCPGRYSKGLFCEIITEEVYFVLKFVQGLFLSIFPSFPCSNLKPLGDF